MHQKISFFILVIETCCVLIHPSIHPSTCSFFAAYLRQGCGGSRLQASVCLKQRSPHTFPVLLHQAIFVTFWTRQSSHDCFQGCRMVCGVMPISVIQTADFSPHFWVITFQTGISTLDFRRGQVGVQAWSETWTTSTGSSCKTNKQWLYSMCELLTFLPGRSRHTLRRKLFSVSCIQNICLLG